jgi:hypothetical protein
MKGPSKYTQLVEVLRGPDPPKSHSELIALLHFPETTIKVYLHRALKKGDLDPIHIPWRRSHAQTTVGERRRSDATAVITNYKHELESLRDENTKLRAAQGLAARETDAPLIPHLVRILQAAGEELIEQAMTRAFPPHAILSAGEIEAEEYANEATAGEVLAGSPAS